jgi:hypothetical protein
LSAFQGNIACVDGRHRLSGIRKLPDGRFPLKKAEKAKIFQKTLKFLLNFSLETPYNFDNDEPFSIELSRRRPRAGQ